MALLLIMGMYHDTDHKRYLQLPELQTPAVDLPPLNALKLREYVQHRPLVIFASITLNLRSPGCLSRLPSS
jgi:hypothetical protein